MIYFCHLYRILEPWNTFLFYRAKNIELEKRLEPCRREETGAEGNQDILSCSTLVDLINQPEEYAQKVEKKGREEKIGRVERIGRVGKVGRIEEIGRVEQIGQIGEVGRIGEVGKIVEIGQIGQVDKIQWAKDENHEEQRRKRKRAEDTNLLKKRDRPSQKVKYLLLLKTLDYKVILWIPQRVQILCY